jgi:hypothetical protein
MILKLIQQNLDVGFLLTMQMQDFLLLLLFHLLLSRLENFEFVFFKLKFLLVQLLQFFLALIVRDLHVLHLLGIVVLLLGLRQLEVAVLVI